MDESKRETREYVKNRGRTKMKESEMIVEEEGGETNRNDTKENKDFTMPQS